MLLKCVFRDSYYILCRETEMFKQFLCWCRLAKAVQTDNAPM